MSQDPSELDPWDAALLEALDAGDTGQSMTLSQLAESSGISSPLLEALAREGLLMPAADSEVPRYDPADAATVRAGLALIEAGLPLAELMKLARDMDDVMRPMADRAIEVFATYVRDSVEASASSDDDAADQLVEAFRQMLPATSELVGRHFRRLLIDGARRRLTES